ncbi:hypothetical protein CR513_31404, partial [Mucuna pruriens]
MKKKYVAYNEATCEIMWLKYSIFNIHIVKNIFRPSMIYYNNIIVKFDIKYFCQRENFIFSNSDFEHLAKKNMLRYE